MVSRFLLRIGDPFLSYQGNGREKTTLSCSWIVEKFVPLAGERKSRARHFHLGFPNPLLDYIGKLPQLLAPLLPMQTKQLLSLGLVLMY